MIKPYASQLAFVSRCLDSALIVLAIVIVGWFNNQAVTSDFLMAGLLGGLLHQILADFTDIYRSYRTESLWAEAKQVALCWTMGFVIICLLGQFSPVEATLFSWPMVAQWFIAVLSMLLVWRVVVRSAMRRLRSMGYNSRSAAIVGTGSLALQVASRLKSAHWAGYKIHGFFDDRRKSRELDFDCRRAAYGSSIECDAIGTINELVEKAISGELDSIYIALPMRAEKRIQDILARLSNSTATVYVVPDLNVFEHLHARSFNLNGLPAYGLIGEPMRGLNGWLKRLEDIVIASIILTMISPLMLFIAALVKLTSPGPAIFKQQRYGLDGKSIKVWKFRTMKVMENGSDFKQATKGDNRITRVGAFLRKTSLDELPQFINVLQGSMSIVGPRPHAIAHNEEYRGIVKNYMRRHKIKPGITGWAQVNGWRGETDTLEKMEKRVEHDLHYIHHWSVWWDIKIIIKTIFKGFIGKNAY
ncbi:undecaprenyl-phosphate glucose phosphotransferase [Aestuariicella hydrocarbonica]|uniref:Undecaprenyl-phosphate glucose phosphotransferase n=1 Tax=Pseudomaricurvus hydrocarbonicus TaxID=1470433 RepID=A0A9E5MQF2_9GAMM|nr:undecaprenyl-phosphate glucose phosphotransferase [Aestuariicella hydrocarbonica]NHO68525.1 undecaprenyl-phosphate glucose phosphotransferase [Aestuariicella hydrocarbonica]